MSSFKLGVMQGRLLPKYLGRYQAHPLGYWQDEFPIAAECGLDLIEFILDYEDFESNPLLNDAGLKEILQLAERYDVGVESVCADYFMQVSFHNTSDVSLLKSKAVLENLIVNCSKLDVKDIVIPCVNESGFAENETFMQQFIENIAPCIDIAEKHCVNLALETDLSPALFQHLLDQLQSTSVTVNYDTGNSAALGYDPHEEMKLYGSKISDIHIKDRKYKGGPVKLGTGDADFNSFFRALNLVDYSGPFIMQAYRDDEGLAVFKEQLAWIKPKLEQWEKGRA